MMVALPFFIYSGKETQRMKGFVLANIATLVVCASLVSGQDVAPITVEYPQQLKNHLLLKNHITIKKMRDKSNQIRQKAGKEAQELDEELCKSAQGHAEYMAEHGNMSHYINGSPGSRAKDAGWKGGFVTENIAYGQNSVESVFGVWRNSGGHYANMTGDYDKCGFGLAYRGTTPYWCAVYARSKLDKKK